VLTAIVIGFAMTAFVVVLSLRNLADHGDDHVDGDPKKRTPASKHARERRPL
jgi:multicomponent K+:H+ antiporter subunit C